MGLVAGSGWSPELLRLAGLWLLKVGTYSKEQTSGQPREWLETKGLEMATCSSMESSGSVSSSKVSGQVAQDKMTSRLCSQPGGQSTAWL